MTNNPLAMVVALGKQAWIDHKEKKRIKKRHPIIRLKLMSDEGMHLRRAVVEALGKKDIYLETEDNSGTYLDQFTDEGLIKVINSANTGDGIMYVVNLTWLGRKYLT